MHTGAIQPQPDKWTSPGFDPGSAALVDQVTIRRIDGDTDPAADARDFLRYDRLLDNREQIPAALARIYS